VQLGAGICVGIAMACASCAMAMAVTARLVPPAIRSTALGVMSAVGSAGIMFIAPIGQYLDASFDWRIGFFGFVVIALLIVPAARIAGQVDKEEPLAPAAYTADSLCGVAASLVAFCHPPLVMMALVYFVCGMQ